MSDSPAKSSSSDVFPHIYVSDTDLKFPDFQTMGYGRYTEFKPLSRGGSAVLQTCRDKNLGRTVVIKTLHAHLAQHEAMRARFLREARVTAQLQHPATVPVYDLGYVLDQRMYFTMKHLEGRTLRQILDQQIAHDDAAIAEFSLDRLLDVLINVCDCLAFAHAHGVVHRDVKPENILVGFFGETTILDWGVAKVWAMDDAGADRIAHEVLTDVNQRPGTPLYMSPEQVRGGGLGIDARTDVYSAAAVLYEILTLVEPLHGKNIAETFQMIANARPMPPQERSPQRNIPRELAAIAMQGLEKKPADRFAAMLEMIAALRCFRSQSLQGANSDEDE